MRDSEEKYRAIFEGVGEAVFVHRQDADDSIGCFIAVNDVACRHLGYSREELLSLSLPQVDPLDEAVIPSVLEALRDGREVLFETVHITKDGRRVPVEVRAKSIPYLGAPAVLSVARDITERKKAEQKRLELERRLLHAQKLESLGILAGGIAHDFNNLLMAILGNLDLALLSIPPGSPARTNIEQSAQAARRASDLTRQMLAYSGRGSFIVKAMDLNELVEENARLFRAAISTTTTLNLQLGKQLPQIEADEGQIQQVIMNLLTNASEAIGEKPGVISLTTGVLDCEVDYLKQTRAEEVPPPGRFVFVEVSDTGTGMDNETQQRLFDPFFTKKKAGRGLGMSAILGIVRGHLGAVLVDSTPGRGTAMRVLFPALAEVQVPEGAAEGAGVQGAGASALCGTVLVVDDEEGVLSVCKAMVAYLGFTVLTASDGNEALSVFQERASEIDLVILDLSMPVMDGMTTLPELLRINPDVKVILSSGFDREDAMKGFSGKGIAGFIQKPYSLEKLRMALQNALKPDA